MNKESTNLQSDADASEKSNLSRRNFVAAVGGIGVGALVGGGAVAIASNAEEEVDRLSTGYLLVDTKKCAGCQSCMLACSMAHYGKPNLSLSRMQIRRDSFMAFPNDIAQNQCRQCPYPSCVAACPVGAMKTNPDTGVRFVDKGKCIGCEQCVNACPFTPSRVQWNFEEQFAQKCDLCENAPYWNHEGGPRGKQTCVSTCPMNAITLVHDVPPQTDEGYEANLRNIHYARLAFPVDDEGKQPPIVYLESINDPSVPEPTA